MTDESLKMGMIYFNRQQAKPLQQQAKKGLAQAKKQVEALILGINILGSNEVKTGLRIKKSLK